MGNYLYLRILQKRSMSTEAHESVLGKEDTVQGNSSALMGSRSSVSGGPSGPETLGNYLLYKNMSWTCNCVCMHIRDEGVSST